MPTKDTIKAVIFDLDGTLLDTEPISEQGLRMVLKELNGSELPWSLRKKLLGRPSLEGAQIIISELQLEQLITAQQLATRWEQVVQDLYPKAQLTAGAGELVQLLMDTLHVPVAIATSSRTGSFAFKRQSRPEFFDKFQVIVCGDDKDVVRGKPAPDIFLVAAKRLGIDHDFSKVLVFEDAINGIRAAKAAGMQVVGIRDPKLYSTAQEIQQFQQEADQNVTSFTQFDVANWNFVAS